MKNAIHGIYGHAVLLSSIHEDIKWKESLDTNSDEHKGTGSRQILLTDRQTTVLGYLMLCTGSIEFAYQSQ